MTVQVGSSGGDTSPEGVIDLGTYFVREPTAREAIVVLSHYADAEDDETWQALRLVLLNWLPLRLASVITAPSFNRQNAMRVALSLLAMGVRDAEKYGREKKKAEGKAKEMGWERVIAEYRHVLNGSEDEPWPDFLSGCARIDEVRARDELGLINATVGAVVTALGGKGPKGIYDRILERLGIEPEPEGMTHEEQMEKLDKLKLLFASSGLGVA